jgi:hypothetical protein
MSWSFLLHFGNVRLTYQNHPNLKKPFPSRNRLQAEFSNSSVTLSLESTHGWCGARMTRTPRAPVHVSKHVILLGVGAQRCLATQRTLSPWSRNSGFVRYLTVRHILLFIAPDRRTSPVTPVGSIRRRRSDDDASKQKGKCGRQQAERAKGVQNECLQV